MFVRPVSNEEIEGAEGTLNMEKLPVLPFELSFR